MRRTSRQFKTLILPNIAALSDAQCEQLRAFVQRGGSLIATYETSLYDEWGVKRKDFGLADLFGVSFAGRTEGPMQNAYLRLEHRRRAPPSAAARTRRRAAHHPRRRARRGGAARKISDRAADAHPELSRSADGKSFSARAKTDIAQVFLRESGKGRVVYFPWDIDRTFWEVLCVDHFKLLRNAVEWATNEEPPVTVTGPGVLDVTVWRQKNSMTVHLVNLTNPMMMKGPVRELIPVSEQQVRVRLPEGARPQRVQLLAANKTLVARPRR